MPLEDSDRIDIVTKTPEVRVQLIITDAGITTDPEERYNKFVAKLKTYVGYVMGSEFKEDYPGKGPGDVTIRLISQTPPTEKMKAITSVTPRGDRDNVIRVEYEEFHGVDEPPTAAATTSPQPSVPPQSSGPLVGSTENAAKPTEQPMKKRTFMGVITILFAVPGILAILGLFAAGMLPLRWLLIVFLGIACRGVCGLIGGVLLCRGRRLGYILSIVAWIYGVTVGAITLSSLFLGPSAALVRADQALLAKGLGSSLGKLLWGIPFLTILVRDLLQSRKGEVTSGASGARQDPVLP